MKLDLAQVKSLFSNADYARGMEYFRQGRVLDMTAGEGENPIVKCCVRGSEVYSVRFQQLEYGYMRIGCSCPRFEEMGRCKHIAAAMIAYVEDPPRPAAARSDRYAQALLQSYLQKSREQQPALPDVPARLVPQLHTVYRGHPMFTFRVGREKLYVVKNIRDFLDNVDLRRTESYGKNLTLDHSMEQFDARSQAMIELLMNEFSQFRSMSGSLYSRYESGDEKNRITLTGDSFDRWFDLLEGEPLEAEWGNNLRLLREDPQVGIRVEKHRPSSGGENTTVVVGRTTNDFLAQGAEH